MTNASLSLCLFGDASLDMTIANQEVACRSLGRSTFLRITIARKNAIRQISLINSKKQKYNHHLYFSLVGMKQSAINPKVNYPIPAILSK